MPNADGKTAQHKFMETQLGKLADLRSRAETTVQRWQIATASTNRDLATILMDAIREEGVALGEDSRDFVSAFTDSAGLDNSAEAKKGVHFLKELAAYIQSSQQSAETIGLLKDDAEALPSLINTFKCSNPDQVLLCTHLPIMDAVERQGFADRLQKITDKADDGSLLARFTLDTQTPTPGPIGRLMNEMDDPTRLPATLWDVEVFSLGEDSEALFVAAQSKLSTIYVVTPRAIDIEPMSTPEREPLIELEPTAKRPEQIHAWLYDAGFSVSSEFGTPVARLDVREGNFAHPDGLRLIIVGQPGKNFAQSTPIALMAQSPGRDDVIEVHERFEPVMHRLLDHHSIPILDRMPRPEPEPDDPEEEGAEADTSDDVDADADADAMEEALEPN